MARGDLRVLRGPHLIQRFQVKAGGAATIKAGEPVIQGTSGDAEYVKIGSTLTSTPDTFVGIAVTDSSDTASADGEVYVAMPTFGTVFRGNAKTLASLSTANLLTKVILELSSSSWVVDESTTTNGFCQMVGMNTSTGEVDFVIDMTEALNA